jgi:hypothetical protein
VETAEKCVKTPLSAGPTIPFADIESEIMDDIEKRMVSARVKNCLYNPNILMERAVLPSVVLLLSVL